MTTTLFITLMSLHLLAVMSPGPDFFIVVKNTLAEGKRSGYMTALWIASWLLIHIIYSILWVGYLISKSILLMSGLKILGWAYLVRIGYNSRIATWSSFDKTILAPETKKTSWFLQWFLTNVFNPKATLYFLSVFTTMVTPETTLSGLLFLGVCMIVTAWVRFMCVSYCVWHNRIMSRYKSTEQYINKFFWWMLILLWVKVLTSK